MKILLCNGAHIGDLILATSVLVALKSAVPNAQIGFLAGSWASCVIEDHTLIDFVHIFDHPQLNRLNRSKKRGGQTWLSALQEIQEIRYDVAIDLYSLYPSNAKSLLLKSQIPQRIGYIAYDHPYYFNYLINPPDPKWHSVERYQELLKECKIECGPISPVLSYKSEIAKSSLPANYILIHMGAGKSACEWNDRYWIQLSKCLEQEYPLVFVGSGIKENKRIKQVTKNLSNFIDLSNCLKWKELIPIVSGSLLVVGLESMLGHMAAALNKPAVVIYGGNYLIEPWRPYHPDCHVIGPAKQYFTADGLACRGSIQTIHPKQVFDKITFLMNNCAIVAQNL